MAIWTHPALLASAAVVGAVVVVPKLWPKKRKKFTGVTIYGATWCPACMELKDDLGKEGIPIRFRDIDRDWAADVFVDKNSEDGAIPISTVKGKTIIGYQPDEIVEAYRS